jgi:aspartokinase/homoserine dehydrogenase 1
MRHNIPVTIRNVFNVAAPGTEIGRFSDAGSTSFQQTAHDAANFVKGFTTVDNIALVNVEGYMTNFSHL